MSTETCIPSTPLVERFRNRVMFIIIHAEKGEEWANGLDFTLREFARAAIAESAEHQRKQNGMLKPKLKKTVVWPRK